MRDLSQQRCFNHLGREAVARYLKEHNVHFFVQEQLKPEQWRYTKNYQSRA